MYVIPKIVEGWKACYITGSGQTQATADRVHIYETEGCVRPGKRVKNKITTTAPKTKVPKTPRRRLGGESKRTAANMESIPTLHGQWMQGPSDLRDWEDVGATTPSLRDHMGLAIDSLSALRSRLFSSGPGHTPSNFPPTAARPAPPVEAAVLEDSRIFMASSQDALAPDPPVSIHPVYCHPVPTHPTTGITPHSFTPQDFEVCLDLLRNGSGSLTPAGGGAMSPGILSPRDSDAEEEGEEDQGSPVMVIEGHLFNHCEGPPFYNQLEGYTFPQTSLELQQQQQCEDVVLKSEAAGTMGGEERLDAMDLDLQGMEEEEAPYGAFRVPPVPGGSFSPDNLKYLDSMNMGSGQESSFLDCFPAPIAVVADRSPSFQTW